MKKKKTKKLVLAKETVRNLEAAHLEQVAAGASAYEACYSVGIHCKNQTMDQC